MQLHFNQSSSFYPNGQYNDIYNTTNKEDVVTNHRQSISAQNIQGGLSTASLTNDGLNISSANKPQSRLQSLLTYQAFLNNNLSLYLKEIANRLEWYPALSRDQDILKTMSEKLKDINKALSQNGITIPDAPQKA